METTTSNPGIFSDFYSVQPAINSGEYEVIYSFFKNTSANATIAKNFTELLFKIAASSGQTTMELFDYIKNEEKIKVNSLFAYYLNSMKSSSALYGVSVKPQPNRNVQRNIVV